MNVRKIIIHFSCVFQNSCSFLSLYNELKQDNYQVDTAHLKGHKSKVRDTDLHDSEFKVQVSHCCEIIKNEKLEFTTT